MDRPWGPWGATWLGVNEWRRLDAIADLPAFLVCAGAGSGKTLAVAAWCAERTDLDLAWLNVGSLGSDPGRLWREVVAVMTEAVGASAPDPLPAPSVLNAPGVVADRLGTWASELSRPLVLVLDDVHAITDPTVTEELQRLVLTAPAALHLVVITRHDPPWNLQRLRLEGYVGELRGDELAFTDTEAHDLLTLADIDLDSAEVSELVLRTRGWAAGLRLAAMHLRLAPDRQMALKSLSGRSGYIADYLMREVYDELPESWKDFLASISVVERVSVQLAEALGASSDAGALLETLARSNTFVHEIGREPGWYRLHPLLLDFLRSRVVDQPRRVSLQREAARWFAAQQRPWEALELAIEAQDHAFAGELIGRNVVTWTVLRSPLELERLLGSIAPNELRSHVGLVIGSAAARMMAGRLDDVDELVGQARSLSRLSTGRPRDRYEFLLEVIDIGSARWRGDLTELSRGLERLSVDAADLSQLDLADWPTMQGLVISNAGASALWLGSVSSARRSLERIARQPDTRLELPVLNARAHLAYLEWEQGNLNEAAALASSVTDRFAEAGASGAVQSACAHLALAGVALDRNQIAKAERHLSDARPALHEPHVQLAAEVLSAGVLVARGRRDEAAALVRAAADAWGHPDLPALLKTQLLRTLPPSDRDTEVGSTSSSASPREALFDHVHSARQTHDLEALERALALAAPHDFRRPFLDGSSLHDALLTRIEQGTAYPEFASLLLTDLAEAAADPVAARSRGTLTLTETEAKVLRYLATPMSTGEIAQALFVSVNTVKTHQRSIHQKLGVRKRRDAVAVARSYDLL